MKGSVAVVAGASRGIGLATARLLAERHQTSIAGTSLASPLSLVHTSSSSSSLFFFFCCCCCKSCQPFSTLNSVGSERRGVGQGHQKASSCRGEDFLSPFVSMLWEPPSWQGCARPAQGGKHMAVTCDVSSHEQVESAIRQVGGGGGGGGGGGNHLTAAMSRLSRNTDESTCWPTVLVS